MTKEPKEPEEPKVIKDKLEKGYHKLLVWRKAKDFVVMVYKYTQSYPKAEEFGLKGQTRRAAVSVVLTLVEGYRRRSVKEFLRFLDISESSLAEVEASLELAFYTGFLKEKEYIELEEKRAEPGYLLDAFENSLRRRLQK